jgi:hypothetical protein
MLPAPEVEPALPAPAIEPALQQPVPAEGYAQSTAVEAPVGEPPATEFSGPVESLVEQPAHESEAQALDEAAQEAPPEVTE